jgi:DNA-directed RNA polymerase specialized sigma24 family protein
VKQAKGENEMTENQKLNSLVLRYQTQRDEADFEVIYAMVTKNWRELETVGKSVRATLDEITALYEDVLLSCIDRYDGRTNFINFYNFSLTRSRTDLYRKKKRLKSFEMLELASTDPEAATFELADEFNLENHIIAKEKADQRQLIDSLLNGADATTTAIVETFLAHPKPTANLIAKELGFHHSKVNRALNRLAANFNPKQYGSHRDYLVAL